MTTANQRTRRCKQTFNSSASKWIDYLTEDNLEHDGYKKRGFNLKGTSGSWNNNDILEAITGEQRVEDDIHPDFMWLLSNWVLQSVWFCISVQII